MLFLCGLIANLGINFKNVNYSKSWILFKITNLQIFEEIEDSRNIFTVDRNGGMIYMQGSQAAPGNTYTVKAAVRDQTRPSDKKAIG